MMKPDSIVRYLDGFRIDLNMSYGSECQISKKLGLVHYNELYK